MSIGKHRTENQYLGHFALTDNFLMSRKCKSLEKKVAPEINLKLRSCGYFFFVLAVIALLQVSNNPTILTRHIQSYELSILVSFLWSHKSMITMD